MMWIRTDAYLFISLFLWCSHTGEERRGLNWGFVSCCTPARQPLSHELVKSWWDVVAGAAFEIPFSHAQDWQRQLMAVSVLSHVHGSPAALSRRSRGNSSWPAPLLALHVRGDVLAAEASLSSWTLSGSWGKAGATWKYPVSVGCQLDHYE